MSRITFKRVAPDEARIYDHDGDHVGHVYRHADIVNAGGFVYLVHLTEDPRGWTRVHDRSRIREVAQHMVDTHPLYG
ncbi:hypothetical protein [Candidatus Rariloculus sp.]|uniref:hypothetical protein n=1 Tax=Candidatus Rariloculus sp. TaxID=3101265 RepID=UPI003D1004BD